MWVASRCLDEHNELRMGLVLENPILCLGKVFHKVYEVFGVHFLPSTLCCMLMCGITVV